ncbi:MAG: two-component system response regulator CreB [Methylococcaceae bacterium]|nr:two-component system response regulator CreB [Methylococcaceae bacterium]
MTSKILVVDDEPSIADNIIYALISEGFEAKGCASGEEATLALKMSIFDLIILDIGLPDISGFELARQIRNNSSVPIIFVTARSDEIDRVVGLEIGADDYVVKPFSLRELCARVKAVLRRTGLKTENEAAHGNSLFNVNEERMQIIYRNQILSLSKIEYRLLKLLIDSPERVYSREQLMDYAWEQHAGISLQRTVDTHIKTIRQKLKAIYPNEDPIITHRGIGYSLRCEL